ncbi:MAG: type VI secretion system-associated FHA domain protein TagH, partial [Gammaproteobacteria bacterium]|nr:type VI secretion system-associated FHA domain protein TagH [Gammaproteobacteria bacterium]
DWILPDPDRYISGRHAVIDCRGGIYYMVDLSTNGVYVNDENEPIGKGNMRRLFNGDRLRMGDFEVVVHLDKGESLVIPLDSGEHELPEDIEMLVDEDSLRTGVQMLDEEEITGDDEFQSALFGTTRMDKEEMPDPAPVADPAPVVEKSFEPQPAAQITREAVPADDATLFDIFLEGLGLSRDDFHPSADQAEIMKNAGEVMREYVEGTARLLDSRTNLKSAFSLDQTSVLPRRNNPLKLSQNARDSIKQLLVGREGEYLGPRNSVREVCRDLLFHQDAFLDAMTEAFVEFADRFDPDELMTAFEKNMKSIPLLGFVNRARYWNLYCDLYPVMTEKGGGRFPSMFAEEFVKAYDQQIADFKRIIPVDVPRNVPKPSPIIETDVNDSSIKTINEKSKNSIADVFDADAAESNDDDFDNLDDGPSADLVGR